LISALSEQTSLTYPLLTHLPQLKNPDQVISSSYV
jgi:hypothetical protein